MSCTPEFADKRISLEGYMVTPTPIDQIADAAGMTADELEVSYQTYFQDANGAYVEPLLTPRAVNDIDEHAYGIDRIVEDEEDL